MSKMNVAVIGLGNMGANHLRVFSECANLVAIADINEESLVKFAEQYHVKGYADFKEMLEKEDIGAVSIAVPTKFHKEVAVYCANKKKHILLEKPIAYDVQEAKEIIGECKKNKVKLSVGHIERFNPAVIELKKRLQNKELSEIYKIEVNRAGPFPARVVDVGVIIDLSVHDLDIIYYLLRSKITDLASFLQQRVHKRYEDSVAAVLKYDNGMIATLNINWLSPNKVRDLRIYGKEGMFKVNYLTQDLYFYENKGLKFYKGANMFTSVVEGAMTKIPVNREEPLKREIRSFIDAIQKDIETPVPGEEALIALENALRLKNESRK